MFLLTRDYCCLAEGCFCVGVFSLHSAGYQLIERRLGLVVNELDLQLVILHLVIVVKFVILVETIVVGRLVNHVGSIHLFVRLVRTYFVV